MSQTEIKRNKKKAEHFVKSHKLPASDIPRLSRIFARTPQEFVEKQLEGKFGITRSSTIRKMDPASKKTKPLFSFN